MITPPIEPQNRTIFALQIPCMVRMSIEAPSEEMALEVLRGLMGSGDWITAESAFGLPFAVKAD